MDGPFGPRPSEDPTGSLPSTVTDDRAIPISTPDAFETGTALAATDASARPIVGHPLLCREVPTEPTAMTAEDYRNLFECRLQEIDAHIEAGRFEEASRRIRSLNPWSGPFASVTGISNADRNVYLGCLYLARSRIEAARGESRTLWRTYYEARGADLTGDQAQARLCYREVMAMPAPTGDRWTPEVREIGRVSSERRRALELEAIERLRDRNAMILQSRVDQLGPAFGDERNAEYNTALLDHLEAYLRSGEAGTVDRALELYQRDWSASYVTYEGRPDDAEEIRTFTVRPGWAFRVPMPPEDRRSEVIRVVIPPEGGTIDLFGDHAYAFPPSDGERVVEIRDGHIVSPHLRRGRDYRLAPRPAESSWSGLRERDLQFFYLVEMETESGLHHLANREFGVGRDHYLFMEAMTLMDENFIWGVDGSHELAAEMFLEILEPEIDRARAEVGTTSDPEADELRALELLDSWYESGELAERNSTAARAWNQYVMLRNPLRRWWIITYGDQISLGHNALLLAATGPLFELFAPAALAAEAPLLARLGFGLRGGLTFGACHTFLRSLFNVDIDPGQAATDILLGGAFGVGGEFTGPLLFRALGRTPIGRPVADWFSRTATREAAGNVIQHLTGGLGFGTAVTAMNPWDDRSLLVQFLDNAIGMGVMTAGTAGSRRSGSAADAEPTTSRTRPSGEPGFWERVSVSARQMVEGVASYFRRGGDAPEISARPPVRLESFPEAEPLTRLAADAAEVEAIHAEVREELVGRYESESQVRRAIETVLRRRGVSTDVADPLQRRAEAGEITLGEYLWLAQRAFELQYEFFPDDVPLYRVVAPEHAGLPSVVRRGRGSDWGVGDTAGAETARAYLSDGMILIRSLLGDMRAAGGRLVEDRNTITAGGAVTVLHPEGAPMPYEVVENAPVETAPVAEDTPVPSDERPTMPPPPDMPAGTPRPEPLPAPIASRAFPRSATGVALAVRHANAALGEETGFRFAIEAEVVPSGEGADGTPVIEVSVPGNEGELAFMDTLRGMSDSLTVETLSDGEYVVHDRTRGDTRVRVRRGLELSRNQQRNLGDWLGGIEPAEREGMSLPRYGRPHLESLVDHLIDRSWTQAEIEGLFSARGIPAEEAAAIIGPRMRCAESNLSTRAARRE